MAEESTLHDDVTKAFDSVESDAVVPAVPAAPAAPAARDEQGRFAAKPAIAPEDIPSIVPEGGPKPPASKPSGVAGVPPVVAPGAAGEPPRYKPPQWKNKDAVAEWDKLPASVQQEVVRRERETHQVLQASAQARHALESMQQVLAPFSANIAAYGGNAVEMIRTLAQVDGTLRFGTPAQKVQALASIIREADVNIEMLDHALANLPLPEAAQREDRLQRLLDERLAPVNQFLTQIQQGRARAAQKTASEAVSELEDFAGKTDIEPVRELMADLIEAEARRGVALTYEQAYEKACWLHPELRKAMIQREQAQAAGQAQAAAARARAAGVSISGAPALAAPNSGQDMSLRDTISAAIDAASGRV